MKNAFLVASALSFIALILLGRLWPAFYWLFILIVPSFLIGLYDMLQTHHSILRNYPFIGRGRWLMEFLRPYIRQYLLESDTDGTPISRMYRSIVYQRAKGDLDTIPFGTKLDTYREGYEWFGHSMSAMEPLDLENDIRVLVGGRECSQPYSASILNISAMSFGSLSKNAIMALNRGAKKGNFAHNTGEGGLSPYHLEGGGDLIWQIGTAYFGCRNPDGTFSSEQFTENSRLPQVKMIEIKISQGAKPGHGGILPASKNTVEIAAIRCVEPFTQVNSPSRHSAFDTPLGLCQFISELRELSEGKPVGFKLAIGRKSEFVAICKAMVETGIFPDFITVDGGEGGTGAAPLEYTNSIGMPLRDALTFVCDCLTGFGLKKEIKVIAAGKILSGFHLVKNMALGADMCNSARGMMLALGCVQSLSCNTNRCPTGVATQNPKLGRGLVVTDKAERVKLFHDSTIHAVAEIIASGNLPHTSALNRSHIYRRINQMEIKRYDQVFPYLHPGCLVAGDIPDTFKLVMQESNADSFEPHTLYTRMDNKTEAIQSDVQ